MDDLDRALLEATYFPARDATLAALCPVDTLDSSPPPKKKRCDPAPTPTTPVARRAMMNRPLMT